MRDARRRGSADARAWLGRRASLDMMPLGSFGSGGAGEAAVRRVLHACRIPPPVLAVSARILSGRSAERALVAAERYAYWCGARAALDAHAWRRLTHGPTILMYHAVGDQGEPASRFVVPASRFERQLRRLARRRRPVMALDDVIEHRLEGTLPPADAVVITFDDGYADTLEVAAPILRRFGFPATAFAVSKRVGSTVDWSGAGELTGRRLLDWDGLATLVQSGVTIGAHSRTHGRLPDLPAEQAFAEVAGSRADLESRLGTPVTSFAYPYGRKSPETVAVVRRAGFAGACGIERGLNDPSTSLLELRRAPVDGDASMFRFSLAVRFGDPDLVARVVARVRDVLAAMAHRREGSRVHESPR
jgi:peptidoglycan/xylan/chitin deacetylase (PgdA/CDA1 family)